jgi:diguanylate cyclase (GGDEF)-like protein
VRALAFVQLLGLAAAGLLAGLTAASARWAAGTLLVLVVLAVTSELSGAQLSTRIRVSGSFLGITLAAVLLGGAPAALVGVLVIAFGWLRSRESPHYLLNNVLNYAWFPLLAGLFFRATAHLASVGPAAPSYYLLVLATFIVALVLNFAGVAGYQCYLERSSLIHKTREVLVPVLAAELFSALLTVAAVFLTVRLGLSGLTGFAVVLVICQYLIAQLLLSKHRDDELQRMASTDALTGVANRERFSARLEQEIAAQRQPDGSFGVLLLDLDHFKEINDTLGHDYGDTILASLGPRLTASVGPRGLVARLGGDEFAILAGEPTNEEAALEQLASGLLAAVREPFFVEELVLHIDATIGIARFPLDGHDAHTLLRRADIAMYQARERQAGYQLYSADRDRHSMMRMTVRSDFRNALDREEIVVYYQPIVSLEDLRPHGAEALVRWRHPRHGLIPPGDFVPIVEQTELIALLSRYVLERAIAQCTEWRAAGHELTVSVNLSVRNLLDTTLPHEIDRLLRTHGLPPEALELELTESTMMSDPDRVLATLTNLHGLGVTLAVDDFGTGFSSLGYLTQLPISVLKLDRSFVSPMLGSTRYFLIVKSTIGLARDLGLAMVAEGVEDEPTLRQLARLGCDRVQGYHLGHPMPADTFGHWLTSARPRLADDRQAEAAS